MCVFCVGWVLFCDQQCPGGRGGGPGPKGHCSSGEMLEALWQGVGAEH